jgi:hypothetical protein
MIKRNRYLALEGDDERDGHWYYHGEAVKYDEFETFREGYGTCTWAGFEYRGAWEGNIPDGWGITTFSDGTTFEGVCEVTMMDRPGTLFMSDGVRCFVGKWYPYEVAMPKEGAMMEANGDVFYAKNEERKFRFYTDESMDVASDCERAWATALKADSGLERTLVGRVVEGGGPMPSGEVRAVRVELADGGTYLGPMRGLSFCSVGVRTDARGGAWRIKHVSEHDRFEDKDWVCMPYTEDEVDCEDWDNHGQSTFAEGQEPDAKEVHHPERIAICFAYTFKFSNFLTYCSFFRAAAEAV